ncbi:MAG: hypothetical protein AAGC55_19215, partial [Myxococcota bacterium]
MASRTPLDALRMLGPAEERPFRLAVIAGAVVLTFIIMQARFCGDVILPAKSAEPEPAEISIAEVNSRAEADPTLYEGYLQKDSDTYGLAAAPTVEAMSVVMPHRVDTTRHELDPDDDESVEIAGLRLTASTQRVEGKARPITVLTIENPGDRPVAYRVDTRPR